MKTKDTAWPPAGVRDLKPDVPVSDKPDHMCFPTMRAAFIAITPSTLTEQLVRAVLGRNQGCRDVEYLCRAYLQFGSEATAPCDLWRLCAMINKLGK